MGKMVDEAGCAMGKVVVYEAGCVMGKVGL
jgi:hypothetical protein